MSTYVLYNGLSGNGSGKAKAEDIHNFLGGKEPIYLDVTSISDIRNFLSGLPETDEIYLCGGDGTLNEVVSGLLMRKELHPKYKSLPIGYIPAGSTNDFANTLELPSDMRQAALQILAGHPFACDIGSFNDRKFCYVAAFGAFTDVSYDTDQNLKNIFGHAAYVLEALKRLSQIRTYDVKLQLDESIISGEFIFGMICNSRTFGGFKNPMSDFVSLDDGLFEIILLRQPPMETDLIEIIETLKLGNPIIDSEYYYYFKSSSIIVDFSEPIPWTIDGEYESAVSHAEIRVLPKAVDIIIP
jgi:YegS/Rv2252/BmrU family lipid kinase